MLFHFIAPTKFGRATNFIRLLKRSMPKVIQYRNKCIGCGICYELQPSLWRMSRKDGKANLVGGVNHKGVYILSSKTYQPFSDVVEQSCPVNAIKMA